MDHEETRRTLRRALRTRALVRFRRRGLDYSWARTDGFVVGLSGEVLLVNRVDDKIVLDGWSAYPVSDLTEVDAAFQSAPFLRRAIELRGQRPGRPPGIRIGTMRDVVRTAGARFPLITLHRERRHRHSCWIGRLSRVEGPWATIAGIDVDARWDGLERYRLDGLTRVDFGGLYEEALALVARDRERARVPGGGRGTRSRRR